MISVILYIYILRFWVEGPMYTYYFSFSNTPEIQLQIYVEVVKYAPLVFRVFFILLLKKIWAG